MILRVELIIKGTVRGYLPCRLSFLTPQPEVQPEEPEQEAGERYFLDQGEGLQEPPGLVNGIIDQENPQPPEAGQKQTEGEQPEGPGNIYGKVMGIFPEENHSSQGSQTAKSQ